MLRCCGDKEAIAARYLQQLLPSFQTVQRLHARMTGDAAARPPSPQRKISISSLLLSPPDAVPPRTPSASSQNSGRSVAAVADAALAQEAAAVVQRVGVLLREPFGRLPQAARGEPLLAGDADPYPTPPLADTPFWFR